MILEILECNFLSIVLLHHSDASFFTNYFCNIILLGSFRRASYMSNNKNAIIFATVFSNILVRTSYIFCSSWIRWTYYVLWTSWIHSVNIILGYIHSVNILDIVFYRVFLSSKKRTAFLEHILKKRPEIKLYQAALLMVTLQIGFYWLVCAHCTSHCTSHCASYCGLSIFWS